MNDIFISYSRRDKDFTLKLFEALKTAKREVWADWEDIPPGSDWFVEIKEGVEQSQAVLFILSPEWIKSGECAKELEYAVQMGKRLIPVIWQNVDPKDVPLELARINWIFMREGDDFEKGFQLLETTMDTDLEWLKVHTRLQTHALEWNNNHRDKSFILRGKDLADAEFQLATNTSKEPHPTDLQREYVFESRRAADKQRNLITSIATTTALMMTALAVAAVVEAGLATKRAKIARAGELASQVQLLTSRDLQGSNSASLLLALEAMHSVEKLSYADTITALQSLYDSLFYVNGTPLVGHADAVASVEFSPDGHWLATTGKSENELLLWDMQNTSAVPLKLSGHDGPIKTAIFSPDSHWLATGSEDNTIRLWNAQNFSDPAIVLKGHDDSVNALAFTTDGYWLASGSADTTVRLWDLHNLDAEPIILKENTDIIDDLTFSPDGHWLASSSEDFTIHLWDMTSPTHESTTLTGHSGSIAVLTFSSDGRWLASGSWDYTVRLWDLTNRANEPKILEGVDSQAITDLAFSPNGNWLAIASGSSILRLWNMQDPSTAAIQLDGHTAGINDLAFSPNGNWLATASADKTNIIWDVPDPGTSTPAIVMKLRGHDADVNSLAFSPDGQWLASGGVDKVVRLWKLQDPAINPALIQESKDVIYAMTFSPDGQRLATGSAEGDIRLWDVHAHTNILLANDHPAVIASLAFSPDAHWLAAGNFNDGTLLLWNITDPKAPSLHMDTTGSIYALAFSADSKQLLTASSDNTVQRWDLEEPSAPTTLLPSQTTTIATMSFSPDGHWLATDDLATNAVSVWNVQNGSAKPRLITEMDGAISALTFDHKGHWLAIGSVINSPNRPARNAIFVWDMEDASKPPLILLGHVDRITTLTFSADDHFLITGSDDGTARIWNMDTILNDTPSIPIHLQDLNGGLTAFALSPDGKTLATADTDAALQVWNMNLDELITAACQTVGRNLTRDEWLQFGFTETYRATCPNWQIEEAATP
jgi:WD40 repeat protein